jgi:hypothetical protein
MNNEHSEKPIKKERADPAKFTKKIRDTIVGHEMRTTWCGRNLWIAINEIDRLTAELKAKDDALDLMLQAFDPGHPNACTQECFDTSDGHGYEVQDIAKRKAYKALEGESDGQIRKDVK